MTGKSQRYEGKKRQTIAASLLKGMIIAQN